MCFTLDMDKERSRALASVSLTHAGFNQLHVAPDGRGVREESDGDVMTIIGVSVITASVSGVSVITAMPLTSV